MSRSLTIDNLQHWNREVPTETIEYAARENLQYPADIYAAIEVALKRNLASCTISVSRTPTPGSDDEVVDISVRGMARATNFDEAIKSIISMGPDAE